MDDFVLFSFILMYCRNCNHVNDCIIIIGAYFFLILDCGSPNATSGWASFLYNDSLASFTNGTLYDSYANITCQLGYRLIKDHKNENESEQIQCMANGKWSNQSGCERKGTICSIFFIWFYLTNTD